MKKMSVILLAILASATMASAAGPKTYQVTGPITDIKGDVIVVENRNGEKWEIVRDANSKVTGEVKVGAKVTVEYTMAAKKIDVAEAKK